MFHKPLEIPRSRTGAGAEAEVISGAREGAGELAGTGAGAGSGTGAGAGAGAESGPRAGGGTEQEQEPQISTVPELF